MKSRSKYFFLIFLTSFLGIALVLIILFSTYLPSYLEKNLIPEMVKEMGIKEFSWDIRRIGLTGIDLSDVTIKADGTDISPALKAASVRIDYTPAGLFRQHLERIVLSGIQVNFEIVDGKFLFPGLDLEKLLRKQKKQKQEPLSATAHLPVTVKSIILENLMIDAKWNGNNFRLPLDLSIFPGTGNDEKIICKAQLFPFGQKIEAELDFDLKKNLAKLKSNASGFSLGSLPSWIIPSSDLALQGTLDFSINTEMNTAPFKFVTSEALLSFQNLLLSHGDIKIKNQDSGNRILRVQIIHNKSQSWQFKVSGLSMVSPANFDISNVNGNLMIDSKIIKTHLEMESSFNGISDVEIAPAITNHWKISGRLEKGTVWQFEMENETLPKNESIPLGPCYRIKSKDIDMKAGMPKINISGEGNTDTSRSKLAAKISRVKIESKSVSVDMPVVEFKMQNSELKSIVESGPNIKKKSDQKKAEFSFRIPDLKISAMSMQSKIPELFISGELLDISAPEKGIDARIRLKEAVLSDDMLSVFVGGINFAIPISWPYVGRPSSKGQFDIQTIRYQNRIMGRLNGDIWQKDLGANVQGNFESQLPEGLIMHFAGNAVWSENGFKTQLDYEIPEFIIPKDLDLGRFAAATSGMTLDGVLESSGSLVHAFQETATKARIKLSDGHFSMKEPSLTVNGIYLDFFIPDLLALKSEAHQKIEFGSASLGDLIVTDGEIVFQMESSQRLFLERSHFRWCGGNVDTNSTLYFVDENDIRMNLYCDRLKLTRVLEQLGGIKGQGEGTVNGRIPVTYHNGKLRFDDGFLFSTPGVGGTIRLMKTDVLMSGIPEGTPQFNQLDLAREALKHYNYDWAKINIDTKNEILHLGLELDGKPVEPLPFVFKPEFGGFVRVERDKPGSHFQGIRLNVNFKLPLDQLLKYGKGISDLLEMSP